MDLEKLASLGEKMSLSGAELWKWVTQKKKEEKERAKEEKAAELGKERLGSELECHTTSSITTASRTESPVEPVSSPDVAHGNTTVSPPATSTASEPEDAFQKRLNMLLKEQKLVLAPAPEGKSRRRRAVMQKASEVWALFRGRHFVDTELQKRRDLPDMDECEETVYRGITWPATPPDKCTEMDCPNWNVVFYPVSAASAQQKYLADIIETVSDFVGNNSLEVGGDLVAIVDLLDMGVARSDTGDNYPGRIASAAQALRVGGLTASTVDALLSRDKPWNEVPAQTRHSCATTLLLIMDVAGIILSAASSEQKILAFINFLFSAMRTYRENMPNGVDIGDPKQELNSPAISIRVGSEAPGLVLGAHVELALPMLHHDAENPTCVFWDTLINEWSPDGCQVGRRNGTHVVCFCQHLSNFAVLMDLHGALPKDERSTLPLRIITWTGCSASVLCLCLCVTVFGCFRSLRNTRTSIHLNLCICLLVAEVVLMFGIDQTKHKAKTDDKSTHFLSQRITRLGLCATTNVTFADAVITLHSKRAFAISRDSCFRVGDVISAFYEYLALSDEVQVNPGTKEASGFFQQLCSLLNGTLDKPKSFCESGHTAGLLEEKPGGGVRARCLL
ncbi:hypothetical protein HPB51_018010 [Rhipicephalus microplus]|uniref:GAIN-B domain-containing protein n=1 Tax=Rhipicephalus microplus TaxID=6941 RepID=A0A9J6D619_RHIMP|nr:hypothetical protein HPB51_018010 [Rhipicephalus microplus]